MAAITVEELRLALASVPAPAQTMVTVDDTAGANLGTVDLSGVNTVTDPDADGGTVDLVGEA